MTTNFRAASTASPLPPRDQPVANSRTLAQLSALLCSSSCSSGLVRHGRQLLTSATAQTWADVEPAPRWSHRLAMGSPRRAISASHRDWARLVIVYTDRHMLVLSKNHATIIRARLAISQTEAARQKSHEASLGLGAQDRSQICSTKLMGSLMTVGQHLSTLPCVS